jgi:hypothetical protein
MLEHYEKAAKVLDIDIDKIYQDMAEALLREELTRKERKKMRKEMRSNEKRDEFIYQDF